jgi:metal-responsive CopG/Arc/MetJ family transcriptional regulator
MCSWCLERLIIQGDSENELEFVDIIQKLKRVRGIKTTKKWKRFQKRKKIDNKGV